MIVPSIGAGPSRLRVGCYLLCLFTVGMLGVASAPAQAQTPAWGGYSKDPQHTAVSPVAAQKIKRIKWQTPVDLFPPYSGNDLFIHYGSPVITAGNTIILPVRNSTSSTFQIEARKGKDGSLLWQLPTTYTLPSSGWIPSASITLTPNNILCYPSAGGIVNYRTRPDSATGSVGSYVFYNKTDYLKQSAILRNRVKICTPITCDRFGNLFFGFVVTSGTPITLQDGSSLQSGLARINTTTGKGTFITAANAATDSSINHIVLNCAPALSNDGGTVYVAASNRFGFGGGYLLALDSRTLAPIAKVRLKDVRNTNTDAYLPDDGTASPTIGPDGDVYFGVLENNFGSNHARGWLLHFSGDLKTMKTPGGFGWDDTASIVPASMVPSYTGTSSYLLITKYNNYAGWGDGQNQVAVLDPNATQSSAINGATVMKEVLTVLGATKDDQGPNYPNAVREWCINSAAVDPTTKSIIVNCEDGVVYRWDMTQKKLTQSLRLTPGIGEAYTPTLIGPDGTVYAINNATLFAVGE